MNEREVLGNRPGCLGVLAGVFYLIFLVVPDATYEILEIFIEHPIDAPFDNLQSHVCLLNCTASSVQRGRVPSAFQGVEWVQSDPLDCLSSTRRELCVLDRLLITKPGADETEARRGCPVLCVERR